MMSLKTKSNKVQCWMQVNLQIANLYFSKGKEEKVPLWHLKQLILMIDIIKKL
jgi:hypothetical protein